MVSKITYISNTKFFIEGNENRFYYESHEPFPHDDAVFIRQEPIIMKPIAEIREKINKVFDEFEQSDNSEEFKHYLTAKAQIGTPATINVNGKIIQKPYEVINNTNDCVVDIQKNGKINVYQTKKKTKNGLPMLRGKFEPGEGEQYYNLDGYIFTMVKNRLSLNSYGDMLTDCCFHTKEDADLYRKILERIHGLNKGWRYSWKDDSGKYYLEYDCINGKVGKDYSLYYQSQGTIYMSENTANTILEEFSQQELKFFVTGVWDD